MTIMIMILMMAVGSAMAETPQSHAKDPQIDQMIRLALGLGSSLSILVSISILILFLRWRELRTTQNRMVAYMTISNTMASLIILVSSIFSDRNTTTMFPDRDNVAASPSEITGDFLHYLMSNRRWILAGNFASSASWSLALPLNLCAVVFAKVMPEKLVRLEMVYSFLFFFVPMIIYAMDGSAGMSWGFFSYIWMVFLAHVFMYLLLGSKIWWTKGNRVSQGHGRYLQTTLSLVLVYCLLWLFPTLHFMSGQNVALKTLLDKVLGEYFLCMLASLAIGSYGFWTGFFYLRWTVDSISSVKKYLRDRQFSLIQHGNLDEERKPLLFPATFRHDDDDDNDGGKNNQYGGTPRILGASAAANGSKAFVGRKVTVVYEYEPKRQDEITLTPSDTILVQAAPDGGWWKGTILKVGGQTGWFPANYVTLTSLSQLNDDDEDTDEDYSLGRSSLVVGSNPFSYDELDATISLQSDPHYKNPFITVTKVRGSDGSTLPLADPDSSTDEYDGDLLTAEPTEMDSLATSYCSSLVSNIGIPLSAFKQQQQQQQQHFYNFHTNNNSSNDLLWNPSRDAIEKNGSVRESRRNSTTSDYIQLL